MQYQKPNILIIDNDDGILTAIETRLSSLGYNCYTASCGMQGLSVFKVQPIDLVITDMNMPSGNGHAVIRALREFSNVPIIVITGFPDDYEQQIETSEDVTVLEKPFDSSHLIDLVELELILHGRLAA